MLSTSAKSAILTRSHRSRHAGGFTLLELLIVIGIIMLLASVALVALFSAQKSSRRARIAADLQTISAGLVAYQQDFHDIPRTNFMPDSRFDYWGPNTDPNRFGDPGAYVLAAALVGPGPEKPTSGSENSLVDFSRFPPAIGNLPVTETSPRYLVGEDGKEGPGFRIQAANPGGDNSWQNGGDDVAAAGKVYGPYIQPDKIKVVQMAAGRWVLADPNGNPYLYFPRRSGMIRPDQPTLGAIRQLTSPEPVHGYPLYFWNDNSIIPTNWNRAAGNNDPLMPICYIRSAMGDTNNNDWIETAAGETRKFSGEYLLWASGPDGIFGQPLLDVTAAKMADRQYQAQQLTNCDDITNIEP